MLDICVMLNWQLSKKNIHQPVSLDCIMDSSVQLIVVFVYLVFFFFKF